jgi:hypothetical protein
VDFDQLLRESVEDLPIEPRDLYDQLPGKAQGYGYLRDVQFQVLEPWHTRREDRDVVIKVNTGGGKTIDALVILQSYLNEGISPALYVAPDDYLTEQAEQEARNLGIAVTRDPESGAYLSGDAIGIVNAAKLFNGHSVFSDHRPTKPRVPIGAVVVDDAHAVIATLRAQFSVTIPRTNPSFTQLLDLFKEDLKQQAPELYLDIIENTGGSFARVPFWAISKNIDAIRAIMRAYMPDNPRDYGWDAIRDVVELSRFVFTRAAVTIVPPAPPVSRVTSFAEAQRRVFLTATLANDSVLVSDFDADPDLVKAPIQPLTAGDIGERMILAPQEINPAIAEEDLRKAIHELSKKFNTLVIVPSNAAMERWDFPGVLRADKDNLKNVVAQLRGGKHLGLVLVANKYDGVDLPQDACRILVIDGLPESFSGDERLEALMQKSTGGIDDRQVQRLEQGMGRAVRSNEDHCVVFLIGKRLAQLTVDPRTLERFSPATRAQLAASRTMAHKMSNTPLAKIIDTAHQALDRDAGWVKYAKQSLRALQPSAARVDNAAVEMRVAFEEAAMGNLVGAAKRLDVTAESCSDARLAGRLLEQEATYLQTVDPGQAQLVLAAARTKNPYVLRPLGGIAFQQLTMVGTQIERIMHRMTTVYGTPQAMRVEVEGMLDRLEYDPTSTEEFEEAMRELGLFLGLGSQRPETELGNGPDNLWALEPDSFWVIEAKSGATSDAIGKRDAAQLGQAIDWFAKRYPVNQAATPVMIHPSRRLHADATAPAGMRIITPRVLGDLKVSVRRLSEGLSAQGWGDATVVNRLVSGHDLTPTALKSRLAGPTGGTA